MTEPDASIEKRQDGGDADFERRRRSPDTRSIWPAIYPELLELVREHTSTIIFVNNRRAAERIAKRLNEMANEEDEEELPPPSTRAHSDGRRAQPTAGRDCSRPPRLALPRGAARWSRRC